MQLCKIKELPLVHHDELARFRLKIANSTAINRGTIVSIVRLIVTDQLEINKSHLSSDTYCVILNNIKFYINLCI